MRKITTLFLLLTIGWIGSTSAQKRGKSEAASVKSVKQIQQLKIGDKLPEGDLILKGISSTGQEYSTTLGNESRENGLMVIFSCNTCPYVIAWEDRYNILAANSAASQIGFVALNSNEAKRDDADSFDAMKKKAKDMKYSFAYLVDEKHVVADAFGATKTPDVFLFNAQGELVYKGAIDDNQVFEDVDNTWLANAAVKMTRNETINPTTTKAVGCTIKRTEKVQVILESDDVE